MTPNEGTTPRPWFAEERDPVSEGLREVRLRDFLGEIDLRRGIRDALFAGLVSVDRGERLRVLDADASADAIMTALSATPAPALDVERLAAALHGAPWQLSAAGTQTGRCQLPRGAERWSECRTHRHDLEAAAIAAEYARLATDPKGDSEAPS